MDKLTTLPFYSVIVRMFFFFSSRRRHTRLQGDWSSDVCSSDLSTAGGDRLRTFRGTRAARYSVFPSAPSRRATQRFDRSLGSTARPTVEQYAGQAPLECHMQFCQGG